MIYSFKSVVTMKPYNRDKWWINSDIIPDMEIKAENPKEALNKYVKEVQDKCYIEISKTALKRKSPMYIDTTTGTKQTGYVITGSTDFDKDYKWYKQFINIWVEIIGIEYKPIF